MKGKDKNRREPDEFEVNYNDRLDGYGIGPPEHMDDKQPYERERVRPPDVGLDDYGLRKQYGPVDQYSFRDTYERRWSEPMRCPEDDNDWREWDRERYDNDDYRRFAGPDYEETQYPGISGKTRRVGTSPNRSKYDHQRGLIGRGPRGYRRSDDRIYEEVCETLMRSPDVDATHIGVQVREGAVLLEGWVQGRQAKKLAEYLIEDLPGVQEVRNQLRVQHE